MVSAPRVISSFARKTAFLPGQPPQSINPIISMGSFSGVSEKAPDLSLIARKSFVPGQLSTVCMHLIIPTFISPLFQSNWFFEQAQFITESIEGEKDSGPVRISGAGERT